MRHSSYLFVFLHLILCLHLQGQSTSEIILSIENHYRQLISSGLDEYGDTFTPVWMSSIDPATGRYPTNDERPANIPQRVYLNRSVSAPKGATAYWNFPDFAVSYELSRMRRNPKFKDAANRYLQFVLQNCKAKNGIILWGNHYYYDVFKDQCVKFGSSEPPQPVDFFKETGDLYEARPFSPVWEILWLLDSGTIDKHVRETIAGHLVDTRTGEFNRHADGNSGYAFIEYGGILCFTLSWLYEKTQDSSLLEIADRIVSYSYSNRDKATGLISNCPTQDRWDKYTSTTEIGLWAGYLLKASNMVPEKYAARWQKIAASAAASWLKLGWDDDTKLYFGGLEVASGEPYTPRVDYPYQPGRYAHVLNPLFPTHDYPLHMAETTLGLFESTRDSLFAHHAQNWFLHIKKQFNGRKSSDLLYAENCARILHFLNGYHEVFQDSESELLIRELVSASMSLLYIDEAGMFRSHTGEIRYDAVDGVGLLALVLLELETESNSKFGMYFF